MDPVGLITFCPGLLADYLLLTTPVAATGEEKEKQNSDQQSNQSHKNGNEEGFVRKMLRG